MPAINGSSMADLVKKQVEQEVAQLHQLLLGAMARITCLENELSNTKAERSSPRPPTTSTSSSQVCRHWLRKRCTWNERCRFSHGSDADSEGSIADVNTKDLRESRPTPSSSSEVKLHNAEDAMLLIDFESNLPPRPQSVSGALQLEPVGDALVQAGFDSDVKPHGGLHCALVEDLVGDIVDKVVDSVAMRQEEEWFDKMSANVDNVQARFSARYSPQVEDDVIYSAEVAIPRVDFSKIKPHLHRNLPKPDLLPIQACSLDPALYNKCTGSIHCNKDHDGSKHYVKKDTLYVEHDSSSRFTESSCPFGELPGFVTSLGVVAVPDEPIGGYVYDGGFGATTKWRLHAEAVFV